MAEPGAAQSLPGTAQPSRGRIAGYAGDALAAALNGLTAAGFEVVLSDRNETEMPDEPLVWRQAFSVGPGAVLWLIAGKNLWEAVGQMILGGAGIDSATDEDCRSTWLEIAGQTMGGVASAMTADQGREVLTTDGAEDAEIPGDQTADAILEVRNSVEIWHVRIAWTSQFGQACIGPADRFSGSQALQPAGTGSHEGVTSKTLDLLLDVALPVSVSFGKTSLQIREVLKLNTGSVVELDRLVSEPVEVIVNNCVIARGEVVVVDGNYGVRVIHLASRADRLAIGNERGFFEAGGWGAMTIPITITDGVAAAGLLAGIVCLLLGWRQGWLRARRERAMVDIQESVQKSLREEMERGHRQCQGEIAEVRETLAEAEKNAQVNLELLRDGRLGMPARARALRMLRSGMSAETAATELGLARNEVRLLEKVSILLAPQN